MNHIKICMIGDYGVGKSSLLRQFVDEFFSEEYVTTIGLNVLTKELELSSGAKVRMVLCDIAGINDLTPLNADYIKGANGYFLVGDSTRSETIDHLFTTQKKIEKSIGEKPFIVLLNKTDLKERCEINKETINKLNQHKYRTVLTSALTGRGVEDSFLWMAERLT